MARVLPEGLGLDGRGLQAPSKKNKVIAMSLYRMNKAEPAGYFIGVAVLRQLEHAPRDPTLCAK